jgi:hypothetical protein
MSGAYSVRKIKQIQERSNLMVCQFALIYRRLSCDRAIKTKTTFCIRRFKSGNSVCVCFSVLKALSHLPLDTNQIKPAAFPHNDVIHIRASFATEISDED